MATPLGNLGKNGIPSRLEPCSNLLVSAPFASIARLCHAHHRAALASTALPKNVLTAQLLIALEICKACD